MWSTKHFPHLIYIHIALEKVHHIQNFSKRTIKEKEQNTAFENTVTLSLYHSWIWKWMLELNKYCTINASKQRKPAWLIKYEPFSLECWKFQRASVYLKVSEWKHLITKHMRMSKTQNRNKAWVLAVIQLKVMQIQNSAFAFWTNRLVTQQSRIADQNLLVLFYVSPCLTNSRLFLYTLQQDTILFWIWDLQSRQTKNKWDYIYICWQVCGNKYKTRLYDGAGDEFKDVTCSMFPEKTFHSLSKKFTHKHHYFFFFLFCSHCFNRS